MGHHHHPNSAPFQQFLDAFGLDSIMSVDEVSQRLLNQRQLIDIDGSRDIVEQFIKKCEYQTEMSKKMGRKCAPNNGYSTTSTTPTHHLRGMIPSSRLREESPGGSAQQYQRTNSYGQNLNIQMRQTTPTFGNHQIPVTSSVRAQINSKSNTPLHSRLGNAIIKLGFFSIFQQSFRPASALAAALEACTSTHQDSDETEEIVVQIGCDDFTSKPRNCVKGTPDR
ncbi:CRE-GIP-1 protein [Caenorhabditis remanei]|uniref:CRE-GIP-1 protein n=1 Tax=Caenorhabditis remanei TaxID=31234 RepID=E3MIR3_CAERE|nr:CRE-GIP-1 protein [Caenorhabditis remanei]